MQAMFASLFVLVLEAVVHAPEHLHHVSAHGRQACHGACSVRRGIRGALQPTCRTMSRERFRMPPQTLRASSHLCMGCTAVPRHVWCSQAILL